MTKKSEATGAKLNRRQLIGAGAATGVAVLAGPNLRASAAPASIKAFRSSNQVPDEITVIHLDEVASLNPYADFTNPGLIVQAHILEPLVDFTGPELTPTPKLAIEWENPTDTTWIFHLRPDVVWHDGTPFTAEDVVFSFETAAGEGSVKARYFQRMVSVKAIDDLTVEVELDSAYAPILASWAYVYIVQKKAYEELGADQYGLNPVGTGPYKLAEWAKEERLVLEAFEDHWNGVHEPSRIIIRPITEAATRVAELQTGNADVVLGVPIEMAPEIEGSSDLRLVVQNGIRPPYFVYNSMIEPFSDLRVRQALNYAVDRQIIVDALLGGYGEVRVGPFSPTEQAFNPDAPEYTYDVEKAKALLAEAGYPDGFEFDWLLRKDFQVKGDEIMQVIANQLAEVGVKANLNFAESSVWTPAYADGDFEVSVNAWGKSVEADSVITGLRWLTENSKFYSNPAVDEIIAQARATFDAEERYQLYRKADALLREDAVALFVYAQPELYGTSARYEWTPYAFGGNAGLSTYYVPKS